MRIVELLDEPPAPGSIEIMHAIDSLTPEWRTLVHEFGFKIVTAIRGDLPFGAEAIDARPMLEYWRAQRQNEWLSTDYVTRRSFRNAA